MLGNRGQIAIIGAIAVVGIAALVTVFYVIPSTGGSAPKVPGVTEKVVFADVTVSTYLGGMGDKGVSIESVTTETRTVPMKMFGAWLPSTSFKGVITAKSINNGREIGEKQMNIESWRHFWDKGSVTKTFSDLRLGKPGDGQVKIKVTLKNNDGVQIDSAHTFRTI